MHTLPSHLYFGESGGSASIARMSARAVLPLDRLVWKHPEVKHNLYVWREYQLLQEPCGRVVFTRKRESKTPKTTNFEGKSEKVAQKFGSKEIK